MKKLIKFFSRIFYVLSVVLIMSLPVLADNVHTIPSDNIGTPGAALFATKLSSVAAYDAYYALAADSSGNLYVRTASSDVFKVAAYIANLSGVPSEVTAMTASSTTNNCTADIRSLPSITGTVTSNIGTIKPSATFSGTVVACSSTTATLVAAENLTRTFIKFKNNDTFSVSYGSYPFTSDERASIPHLEATDNVTSGGNTLQMEGIGIYTGPFYFLGADTKSSGSIDKTETSY